MSISSIQRKEHYNGGRGPFSNWVDYNTVKNTQCVISNVFLIRNSAAFKDIGLTNQYRSDKFSSTRLELCKRIPR